MISGSFQFPHSYLVLVEMPWGILSGLQLPVEKDVNTKITSLSPVLQVVMDISDTLGHLKCLYNPASGQSYQFLKFSLTIHLTIDEINPTPDALQRKDKVLLYSMESNRNLWRHRRENNCLEFLFLGLGCKDY